MKAIKIKYEVCRSFVIRYCKYWMTSLDTRFHPEFTKKVYMPYILIII